MPKRLRDSQSYDDPFVRRLSAAHKHLWFYILDKCDHAGIWKVDLELAAFFVGLPLDQTEAETALSEKVQILDNKTWFIPGFILFQYGFLNDKNTIHQSVLNLLKNKGLEVPLKALPNPYQRAKAKDKVKDKVKAKAEVSLEPNASLEISKSNNLSADAESPPPAIAPKPKPAPKERTPEEILLAAQVKEVRDYFWAEFKKLPGRASGPTYPTWKQFVKDEAAVVKQHGVTEMKRRTNNCLRSGYNPNPTYLKFIQEPDKWVELMEKRVQGDPNDYKSKRGTFDLGAAKGMLGGLSDHFSSSKPKYEVPAIAPHTCRFIIKEEIVMGNQVYACNGCYRRETEGMLNDEDRATVGLPPKEIKNT